jgi:hypothetical protein
MHVSGDGLIVISYSVTTMSSDHKSDRCNPEGSVLYHVLILWANVFRLSQYYSKGKADGIESSIEVDLRVILAINSRHIEATSCSAAC